MDFDQSAVQNENSFFQEFFCFQKIVETAIRYWRIVVICGLLGVLSAFLLTKYVITPKYVSSTTLYAWQVNQLNDRDVLSSYRSQLMLVNMLINDYQELMTSKLVQEKVQKSTMEYCAKHDLVFHPFSVEVDAKRDTRIITITVSSASPDVAQYAAKETAAVFGETIREVLRMDNVQVIDEAQLPSTPSQPSKKKNLVLGLIFGLICGGGIALLLGLLDQTIKNADQASSYLKKPVVGTIPLIYKVDAQMTAPLWTFLKKRKYYELGEAFRVLRANLPYLVPESGKKPGARLLMITSALAGEGKSSCLSTLSVLIARTGKRVLLIDADLRRPTLHRIFDLPHNNGLVPYVAGVCSFDEAVCKGVGEEPLLDVMPCGPIPPNPSELLLSKAFSNLLEMVREKYDYVLVDTAPSLFLSDPMSILPFCDGVLFSVSCGLAKIGLLRKALAHVSQISQLPIGLVVNHYDRHGQYGGLRYKSYYKNYSDYRSPYRQYLSDKDEAEADETAENGGKEKAKEA